MIRKCYSKAQCVECSSIIWETWVQSQVGSYQRLKKWFLIPTCLTLIIIRYVSRVKWSNPGKDVVPSPAPLCSSYWKGNLRVTLDNSQRWLEHIWDGAILPKFTTYCSLVLTRHTFCIKNPTTKWKMTSLISKQCFKLSTKHCWRFICINL